MLITQTKACSCECITYPTYLTTSQHLCINACSYSNACSWYSIKRNTLESIEETKQNKTKKTKQYRLKDVKNRLDRG